MKYVITKHYLPSYISSKVFLFVGDEKSPKVSVCRDFIFKWTPSPFLNTVFFLQFKIWVIYFLRKIFQFLHSLWFLLMALFGTESNISGELFVKVIKSSILDVWQGSVYVYAHFQFYSNRPFLFFQLIFFFNLSKSGMEEESDTMSIPSTRHIRAKVFFQESVPFANFAKFFRAAFCRQKQSPGSVLQNRCF